MPSETSSTDQTKALKHLQHGASSPFDGDIDNPTPAVDWAHAAARGVLANLLGRRGVGDELEQLDQELRDEIVEEVAEIIRVAKPKGE
jgi:hypothetical protein